MSVPMTGPGVYVQEVRSGARSITGCATSITAFVGRTAWGPVQSPTTVSSFDDFTRRFGGLWQDSALGYSVRDFFANGGSVALVVRLENGASPAQVVLGRLTLSAVDAGSWANSLRVRVDHDTEDPANHRLFNLYVRDGRTGLVEEHRNVTVGVAGSSRDLRNVLVDESRLVRVEIAAAELPPRNLDPSPGADPWATGGTVTSVGISTPGSDGLPLQAGDLHGSGPGSGTGMYSLEDADLFNLLVVPPYRDHDTSVDPAVVAAAAVLCEQRRAMLVVDPLPSWSDAATVRNEVAAVGTTSRNAGLYLPRFRQPDPLRDGQLREFAPSGAVAGVIARTDAQRGVWKAPAGHAAGLTSVPELTMALDDTDIGLLNPFGVNCLRTLQEGTPCVWGARTMEGRADVTSEWKYVPVRRTALFIEESILRGTRWAVFEPNDERLWAAIRLAVGAFLHDLFRRGALIGQDSTEAYFVRCGSDTTSQADINDGVLNIVVGFAPLKPAEFVVIGFQQTTAAETVP
jgi:phage tail sheath protein FI